MKTTTHPFPSCYLPKKSQKKGKEAARDDNENSDDDSGIEIIHSPSLKQHPVVAKLARGRQHKPFSPSGNQTAII